MGLGSQGKPCCRYLQKSDYREEAVFPGEDFEFSIFHGKRCLKKVNLGVKVVEIWPAEVGEGTRI